MKLWQSDTHANYENFDSFFSPFFFNRQVVVGSDTIASRVLSTLKPLALITINQTSNRRRNLIIDLRVLVARYVHTVYFQPPPLSFLVVVSFIALIIPGNVINFLSCGNKLALNLFGTTQHRCQSVPCVLNYRR